MITSLSALAHTVQAEPAPTAKDLVRRGDRLFRMHLYEEAVVDYQNAMALAPSSSTLRRIADAHREAGDVGKAADAFERLAAMPDASRADRTGAENALQALSSESGLLTVKTEVPTATVFLDGRPLGSTPLAGPARIAPGTHVVVVEKEGFARFTASVDVKAGASSTVSVELRPLPTTGVVYVTAAKERALAFAIDGKPAGTTPLVTELDPGEHTFQIVDPKFRGPVVSTRVERHARSTVFLDAAELFGFLRLRTEPSYARISVDGVPLRPAQRDIELAAGRHTVEAAAPGYEPVKEVVEVFGGKPTTWSFGLVPAAERPVAPTTRPADVSGGHFDVELGPVFSLNPETATCPTAGARPTCEQSAPIAGGLLFRGGYNFDPVAIDLTALAFGGTYESSVELPGGGTAPVPDGTASESESFRTVHYGGIVAIGPSITSRGSAFRVTAGAAGGLSIRGVTVAQTLAAGNASTTSDLVTGPAATAHAGIVLGSTPGAKFTVSALFAMEHLEYVSPTITRTGTPGAGYRVFDGFHFHLGPTLGVRFGY